MRKSRIWQAGGLLSCLLAGSIAGAQALVNKDLTASANVSVSATLLERARNDVFRIKALVEQGTLPKKDLEQAELRLADAQDEFILSETLYGQTRLQDLAPDRAQDMIAAAQRRVDLQTRIVAERQELLTTGVIAPLEFQKFQDELDSRKGVLELARNRLKLFQELRQMAENEKRLEHPAQSERADLKEFTIRYEGNGQFSLADLPTISNEFQRHFHRPLPVSAFGQTLVHQSMLLDHRNRVDVALNPDEPEGLWLRQLLERLHVPYLAFRNAIAGAATAPHIHIGPGSTHLKIVALVNTRVRIDR